MQHKFNAMEVQQKYEKGEPHQSFSLTTCSISGLPLGWLPSKKLAYRARTPFEQLTVYDCRISLEAAFLSGPKSPERVFAFFALLYKLPPRILEIHCQHISPDWGDNRLSNILGNNGLRTFAAFVETVNTISVSALELFPQFRIASGFFESNTNLRDFPQCLARWVGLLESSKQSEKERRKFERAGPEIKLFARRARNEKISIFDPSNGIRNKSFDQEVHEYSIILAEFYERKHTPQWENFVRNPSSASYETVKKILDRVREINAAESDISDALALSAAFKLWLEEHHFKLQAANEVARKMTRLINNSELYMLQSQDVDNVQELLESTKQMDIDSGKPTISSCGSMENYLTALTAWRKTQNTGIGGMQPL